MDWSATVFAIFLIISAVIFLVLLTALYYIKKVLKAVTRPITSRTSRK